MRKSRRKKQKGFSLAEVLTISAVFLIVMMVSLTILLNGWKIITKVENSATELRDTREALAKVSNLLRDSDEIFFPDRNTLKTGTSLIAFTKNNDDILNPVKETFELSFNNADKTIILRKYGNNYPDEKDIKEEKIIGKGINNFSFKLIQDKHEIPFEANLVYITISSISKNIKIPNINLSTNVKMK